MSAHTRHLKGYADNRGPDIIGLNGGFEMIPRPWTAALPDSPILRDIHTIWDRHKFAEPRTPLFISEINDRQTFSGPLPANVKTMPVRIPGGKFLVPGELIQFDEALQIIIDFETAANPHFDEYYCYIVADRRMLQKGECQRGGGLHSDAVQGTRIPNTAIDRTYLVIDHSPTRFFPQAFNMAAYPEDEYWFNAIFEEQADWTRSIRTRPYIVNAFDPYTIHSAEPVDHDGPRVQFGVTFSVRPYDRTGNTINALLPKLWEPVARPLPPHLKYLDRPYGLRPTGY